jgi:hypothetical protein
MTPLMYSLIEGNEKSVRLLLDLGADVRKGYK